MAAGTHARRAKRRPISPSTRRAKKTIKKRGAPTTARRVIIVQERPVVRCRVQRAVIAWMGLRVATTLRQHAQTQILLPFHPTRPHVLAAN